MPAYGFVDGPGGAGPDSLDSMSWVKMGYALVGQDCRFAGSPHRVKVTVEDYNGRRGLAVRAWTLGGQADDFDPDLLEPVFLSDRVVGMNCRAAFEKVADEIQWQDEWERTNRIPTVVEVTLYLAPLEEGGPPVEMKRLVGIPTAGLCYPPNLP
jgi:hypothetical protein